MVVVNSGVVGGGGYLHTIEILDELAGDILVDDAVDDQWV